VALRQLVEMGLNVRLVDKRVAAGRLHPIHQGVYAVGHRLLSADGHRLAATIACGPRAVLSHRSAAALLGLRGDSRNRIDVTAPGRRGRLPAGIDAHRDGSLCPVDRTEVRSIPCTSVARTLLDLAAVVSARELQNAVTQAEVERVFDLTAVREVIGRSRRRRGVARLRLAISLHDPRDEAARAELERRFLQMCRTARLPLPAVNTSLLLDGVAIEPDFLWREARLIVETDGRRTHGTAAAFENDRRRDQRLKVAGWDVIRCTWRQVLDGPADLTHTLRTLLSRTPVPAGPG
jgi:very-short-patch-repair endonuclease